MMMMPSCESHYRLQLYRTIGQWWSKWHIYIRPYLLHWEQWRRNEFESGGGVHVAPENIVGPSTFLALQLSRPTISRFRKRFRDGQYSLVSFLFAVLLLTVPHAQPFVKAGGTCLFVPYRVGATDTCTLAAYAAIIIAARLCWAVQSRRHNVLDTVLFFFILCRLYSCSQSTSRLYQVNNQTQ